MLHLIIPTVDIDRLLNNWRYSALQASKQTMWWVHYKLRQKLCWVWLKPSRSVHTHTVNSQNAPAQTTSFHAAVDRNTTCGPKSFIARAISVSEVYLNSNLAGPTTPVKALFNFFPSWAFHHTWNISVSTHIKAPRELQPDHYFQLFFFSTTGDCLTEWILGWALHVCRCFMNRVFS